MSLSDRFLSHPVHVFFPAYHSNLSNVTCKRPDYFSNRYKLSSSRQRRQRSVNFSAIMLSLLFLLVASAFGADITNNTAPDYIGDYKLVFVSPKPDHLMQNCGVTKYSYIEFTENFPSMTSDCGRKDAYVVLLRQKTKYVGHPVLFDIVKDFDEAARALDDDCHFEPYTFERVVALKLSDNLMLQYQHEGVLRHYILAKVPPSEAELREVVSTIKGLKYEDGLLVCK